MHMQQHPEFKQVNIEKISQHATNILERNPLLFERIKASTGLPDDKVKHLFVEMLQFLHVSANADFSTVPSSLIDEAWHEFILFTKEYTNYCVEQFGFYLHHTPGMSLDTELRYQETKLQILSVNEGVQFFPECRKAANCGCDGGNTVRAIAKCGCDGGNTVRAIAKCGCDGGNT